MISFLADPILRGPILGCVFMCLAASLMGVVVFLKKRSLLGEALSHAAYPGVVAGLLCCSLAASGEPLCFALGGAVVFAWMAKGAILWMERRGVRSDAALCFVLASFFGLGVLGASLLQEIDPALARQAQTYLYGQAATMTDIYIAIYAALAVCISLFLALFYRPLQAQLFDSAFCSAARLAPSFLQPMLLGLLLLSVVIGIRSVGVVLMSGMLIAPAAAARQFTDRLSVMFVLSALFGMLSASCGAFLSVTVSIPTGPSIVLFGALFALLSLLFAPKRGRVSRAFRIFRFRMRCVQENILKSIWKKGPQSLSCLLQAHRLKAPTLFILLWGMRSNGWLIGSKNRYHLSQDGAVRAAHIVRLHRLWESYLASKGWEGAEIHRNAEEMEHILTVDLEERLAHELSHPRLDPHLQPIPEKIR